MAVKLNWKPGDFVGAADLNSDVALGAALNPIQVYATGSYVVGSGGDDYPALAAAMAAGGRVHLSAANLRTSRPVIVPAGAYIEGYGATIEPMGSMASMLVCTGGNTVVRGLRLNNASGLAQHAVEIAKPYDNFPLLLADIKCAGFVIGFYSTAGDVVHLERPWTQNCTTGVFIANGLLNSSITQAYLLNGNGIDIDVPTIQQPEGLDIIGGKVLPYQTGQFGIRIRSGLEIHVTNVTIDQLLAPGSNGIILDSTHFAVKSIKIIGNWFGKNLNATGTGCGIQVFGGAAVEPIVAFNTFDSYDAYGLAVDGADGICLDLKVVGNKFNPSGAAIADMAVRATRAMVTLNEFNHPQFPVAVVSTGFGVDMQGLLNRFAPGTAPQVGNIDGSFWAFNRGNTNDSLDGAAQNIGLNRRIGRVVADSFDMLHGSEIHDQLIVDGKLTVGAGFDMAGDGALRGNVTITGDISAANVIKGTGSPAGIVAAPVGTLFLRGDGAPGATFYVKESGPGTTAGWTAK